MSSELAERPARVDGLEKALIEGDLSKLSVQERMTYYTRVCESMGLNPLTKPFQYITLNGKLTLYATRDCADQLRRINKVTVAITGRDRIDDVYVVTARATLPDGRADESTGAVTIGNLKGDSLANALMKAETKSKRRVTLSICGLGWLDETETETIPHARVTEVEDDRLPVVAHAEPVPFTANDSQEPEPETYEALKKDRETVATLAQLKKFWPRVEAANLPTEQYQEMTTWGQKLKEAVKATRQEALI